MASKYGDGFVTSASHPELAEQYGNVGTSNPYTGASRPGTAAAVLTAAGKAPVSGTFNPSNMPDIAGDFQPIKDGFLELVTAIQGMQLSVGDRKQLAEGEKGVAILVKKLARGDIDAQIAGKVLIIVNALRAGDYNTAVLNQTALVNSDWRDHRDWLKGIKNLIQLAAKKMSGR
jgi:protein transport protein SEC31